MVSKFKEESKQPTKDRSCVYDLHYHLVWVTKYREKAFKSNLISSALKHEIKQIAKANKVHIEAMEVMPNHIHLLVSAKPVLSVTVIIKKFKGITGKWLFQTFPKEMRSHFRHHQIWSHTYYAGSVGNTTEAVIKHYVQTQKSRPYR